MCDETAVRVPVSPPVVELKLSPVGSEGVTLNDAPTTEKGTVGATFEMVMPLTNVNLFGV